jgi:hypothetical protein
MQPLELIQGIEKIAELKLRQQKQFSLRMIMPLSSFRRIPCIETANVLKGFGLSSE